MNTAGPPTLRARKTTAQNGPGATIACAHDLYTPPVHPDRRSSTRPSARVASDPNSLSRPVDRAGPVDDA
jgi:hypothetical protein